MRDINLFFDLSFWPRCSHEGSSRGQAAFRSVRFGFTTIYLTGSTSEHYPRANVLQAQRLATIDPLAIHSLHQLNNKHLK